MIQIIGKLRNNNRIFLSLPQQSGFEEKYIQKALNDSWITSGGPNVNEFENKLENFFKLLLKIELQMVKSLKLLLQYIYMGCLIK